MNLWLNVSLHPASTASILGFSLLNSPSCTSHWTVGFNRNPNGVGRVTSSNLEMNALSGLGRVGAFEKIDDDWVN